MRAVECFLSGGCEGPQAGLPRHAPVRKNESAACKGPGLFQATAPNLTKQLNLFPFFSLPLLYRAVFCHMQPQLQQEMQL